MKDIIERSRLSSIQLAKCLKSVKSIAESKEEFEDFVRTSIPEDKRDRVAQIIQGLEQEDDFAILCRLMGTCESLVRLDQTPLIDSRVQKAPDFLATFRPGCHVMGKSKDVVDLRYSCFVEVKSCKDQSFKISEKDLSARTAFARQFGLPLVFAVRVLSRSNAMWMLLEADELRRRGRKVDIHSFCSSLRHVLFDDYMLMPIPNLHIAHYYDSDHKVEGIRHREFGAQVRTQLILGDERVDVPHDLQALLSALLDAFSPTQVQVERRGNIACQVLRITKQMRTVMDLVYFLNRLPVGDDGHSVYDPTRISSRFDSSSAAPLLFTREMVDYLGHFKMGTTPLFLLAAFEEPKKHLERLLALREPTPV